MAKLDQNAVIAKAKLTEYLLVQLAKDDKSQFLAQAGYTINNWRQLERDLREQILSLDAIPTRQTQYGQKYAITGDLSSPNGITIRVKTIWIDTGAVTQFVTLFPA
ncbi:DUF6883 domain-containing protein [Leptolyngbyaceae cyanobacterium UHCC 1019]